MLDFADYNNVKNLLLSEQNVSRETFLRLEQYVNLLLKWNESINLVSPNTIGHLWSRHILDSAQLLKYVDLEKIIVDVGSGGGLPGLVLAILGAKNMHLVDKDTRKCVFLQQAIKYSQNLVKVHNCLFDDINIANIDIIIARAFSNIAKLLAIINKKINKNTELLLLKGQKWQEEIKTAMIEWDFEYSYYPSITDNYGVIIRLTNISQK
jgi:16S rRNA (guanine527-N7)-methyltransferase